MEADDGAFLDDVVAAFEASARCPVSRIGAERFTAPHECYGAETAERDYGVVIAPVGRVVFVRRRV